MDAVKKFFKSILLGAGYIVALAVVTVIAVIVSANIARMPKKTVIADPQMPASQYSDNEHEQARESETPQTPEDTSGADSQVHEDDPPITGDAPDRDNVIDDGTGNGDEGDDHGTDERPGQITPYSAAPVPLESGVRAAIEKIADSYGAVGVQVAVIKNGEIAGTAECGYATVSSYPMAADTKIRAASISKVVLAMTVMRLRELGDIGLDTDIGVYWGTAVRNPRHRDVPITTRQMLSHMSSIRIYDYGFPAGGDVIRRDLQDGSCFEGSTPGSVKAWAYNNYAFAALGVMVENVANETVNSLSDRYLFKPLGIDAAFGSGSISATDKLATLYTRTGRVGRSVEEQKQTLGNKYPGERGEEFPGGLTISAYDLAKLIAVLAGDGEFAGIRILSTSSVALMETSQGRTGGFDQCLPLRHRTYIYGQDELLYHTGSNYGVYSLISYNPVTRDGVVVLTTGANGATDEYGIYAVCGEISEYIYRNM